MNSITTFIWEKLYPELYPHIPDVFPEMGFVKYGSRWISPKKADGTAPKKPRRDKTIISERFNGYVKEQGDDTPTDIITLFASKNGYNPETDLFVILDKLCRIAGIEAPQRSAEWERKYREEQDRQSKLLASYERQRNALFAPEGKDVLRYLTEKRGYTENEIRLMGLGYISQEEGERLQRETNVGIQTNKTKYYPLSWAFYSKGRIHGFKFRAIDEEVEKRSGKYDNTLNLPKNENPFGLTSFDQRNKATNKRSVVVVEGELDALRCHANGLPLSVIATTGNALSKEAVTEIQTKGYRDVILLLDNDEAGKKFVPTSIKNIEEGGLNAFVSVLPEGMGHDPDEFFKLGHSVEDLTGIVSRPRTATRYQYDELISQYGTNPSELEYIELEERFVELAGTTKDPIQKHRLLYDFSEKFGKGSVSNFEKAITEKTEKAQEERKKSEKKQKAEEALKKALSDLTEGNTSDAERTLSGLQKDLRVLADRDKFKPYLYSNSDEIFQSLKQLPKGLNSGFQIESEKDPESKSELIFPEGGITLIGGGSNHGKSTVLKNIVINALNERKKDINGNDTTKPIEGTLLYFTYEENIEAVTRQFINAYANINLNPLDEKKERKKNIEIVEELLSGYSTNCVRDSRTRTPRRDFVRKVREFKKILDEQRLKIIRLGSNFHDELLGVLRFLKEEFPLPVRAVFVDYVQCLSVENNGKNVIRTEELKEIMTSIDQYVQEAKIPFIMTAQLSRKAKSFGTLNHGDLDSSSWLEKTASEILLIWSNRFDCELEKNEKIDLRLNDGRKGGTIGAKLTKSRRYPIPSVMFLDIDEKTGRMSQQNKVQVRKQKQVRFDIDKVLSSDLFDNDFFNVEEEEEPNKASKSFGVSNYFGTPAAPQEPEEDITKPKDEEELPF